MKFKLHSSFGPTGDQPEAIRQLTEGIKLGMRDQVLLGVTGSGKTFSVANVIEKIQRPTLIISHNKTLAAQLYQEFRDFFPQNAVSYFVSYYDYYQPEAYLPQTDTYIEKETEINEEIDKLRLQATANLLERNDVIVVSSVSCLYNLGSPKEYEHFILGIKRGERWERKEFLKKLTGIFYERADYEFARGNFRVRGEVIDVYPANMDEAVRMEFESDVVVNISLIDPWESTVLKKNLESFIFYPAKHYLTDPENHEKIFFKIREDLEEQVLKLKNAGKDLEAHRLKTRVNFDLDQIKEFGYVKGIENYSRYFDGRQEGEPPYSLLDYFPKDYLLVIDESHMTVSQIRGMYEGDRSRKEILIGYGFRLPAAKDNRPLKFNEFLSKVNQTIYTSATPGQWELERTKLAASKLVEEGRNIVSLGVVEQLIRPTGVIEPQVVIRPTKGQIENLISEIEKRVLRKERVLVTTLTKRMAEDLAHFLKERGIKVHHLHSEIETLDRLDILDDLRLGRYDVVVGINLLREGLDLPEVSLVVILDADREGFLRSETSLIQVMGRAARHTNGMVIMYADQVTGSMERAINEVKRRRKIQLDYNREHGVVPKTIIKPIRQKLIEREKKEKEGILRKRKISDWLEKVDASQLVPMEKRRLLRRLKGEMRALASDLEFEMAAQVRDKIREIEENYK